MKKIFLPILLLMIFVLGGCGSASGDEKNSAEKVESETETANENKKVSGDLKITMLNVGQGDSILIQTKSQNILIDTSDTDERTKLVDELDKAGVTTFDKIILTHPHADHIGGIEKLLKDEKFTVKEVYDNGIAASSKLYLNYMNAIKADKNIKHKTLKAGDTVDFGDGVNFEVLYPTKKLVEEVNSGKRKSDPNNESIVGRLVYKNFSMMFTGDAEKEVESNIWADNDEKKLQSKVLKSGHHGSYTASTENFLKVVKPIYVLISAGEPTDKRGGNTYGHPHVESLENYLSAGISSKNIFWTWKNGTITIISDGKNFSVTPEHKEDWVKEWIAEKKKNSKK
ncbi:MAG: MBL fold metallo-hydrolase [Selenomonadaceae bacterium]|nr:MBL fold metallo-hydrolase [Selenomonadaceae bacterium]